MTDRVIVTRQSTHQSTFRAGVILTVVVVLVLSTVLLFVPASSETMGRISDGGQAGGPFLILCLWLGQLLGNRNKRDSRSNRRHFAAQLCIGAALVFEVVAQTGWAVNEQILHVSPFPSWTDVCYLAFYPCLFLGIFLLPGRRRSMLTRVQLAIDALAVTTAVATFSWYFLIGPLVFADGASRISVIVSSLYPIFDLVLITCLVALWVRSNDQRLRRVLGLLTASSALVVVADSGFQYLELVGSYRSGTVLDLAWVLADMLLGLAAIALLAETSNDPAREEHEADEARGDRPVPSWLEYLPYIALPFMLIFFIHVWHQPGTDSGYLQTGVLLGCILFTFLVVVRQFLALRENQRLHRAAQEDALRLEEVNREVIASNLELAEVNARLESLATTDPLTNLLNHRAINGRIDQEIERAYRYGREFSLLFIDLDHFKTINDSYGHAAGDIALEGFSTVVRQNVRGVDVIARWGGEEFLVILPEVAGTAAVDCAERIRESVAGYRYPIAGGIHLTCSIGIATYPDNADDRGRLIELADEAMYAAKRLGRNQVRRTGEAAVSALLSSTEQSAGRDDSTLIGVVGALAALVEARDRYTGRHMAQVGRWVARLALRLGFDASESQMLGMAGLLHDIGKVGVPDAILQTPVNLTRDEWDAVRLHTIVGADVVSRVSALRPIAPIIRGHHEHWDGSGYPDGLAGKAIPYGARIVAVVDAFGAMTSDRPYRVSRSHEMACAELRRGAGRQFDPAVVETFLAMLETEDLAVIETGSRFAKTIDFLSG